MKCARYPCFSSTAHIFSRRHEQKDGGLAAFEDQQKKHFFKHINDNLCKDMQINRLQGFHPTKCPPRRHEQKDGGLASDEGVAERFSHAARGLAAVRSWRVRIGLSADRQIYLKGIFRLFCCMKNMPSRTRFDNSSPNLPVIPDCGNT